MPPPSTYRKQKKPCGLCLVDRIRTCPFLLPKLENPALVGGGGFAGAGKRSLQPGNNNPGSGCRQYFVRAIDVAHWRVGKGCASVRAALFQGAAADFSHLHHRFQLDGRVERGAGLDSEFGWLNQAQIPPHGQGLVVDVSHAFYPLIKFMKTVAVVEDTVDNLKVIRHLLGRNSARLHVVGEAQSVNEAYCVNISNAKSVTLITTTNSLTRLSSVFGKMKRSLRE